MKNKNTNDLELKTVEESFEALRNASVNLNTASDALGGTVAVLNDRLKQLNLGVSFWFTWVVTQTGGRAIGYSKVGNKWGLAIKQFRNDGEEVWAFNEAPRWMRIEAVKFLPHLLEAGVTRSEETCRELTRAETIVALVSEQLVYEENKKRK